MLIYKDVRGQYDESTGTFGPADGIVDEQDYIKISHRASNPYGGTLNFGFSYKDFSISAQFGASWGAYSLSPITMRKESYSDIVMCRQCGKICLYMRIFMTLII